jgi:hypothetical protein
VKIQELINEISKYDPNAEISVLTQKDGNSITLPLTAVMPQYPMKTNGQPDKMGQVSIVLSSQEDLFTLLNSLS